MAVASQVPPLVQGLESHGLIAMKILNIDSNDSNDDDDDNNIILCAVQMHLGKPHKLKQRNIPMDT